MQTIRIGARYSPLPQLKALNKEDGEVVIDDAGNRMI